MRKFFSFVILLLIAAWFIAVNPATITKIVIFFPVPSCTIEDIPLAWSLLVAFFLGAVVALLFPLILGKKNRLEKSAPNAQGGASEGVREDEPRL